MDNNTTIVIGLSIFAVIVLAVLIVFRDQIREFAAEFEASKLFKFSLKASRDAPSVSSPQPASAIGQSSSIGAPPSSGSQRLHQLPRDLPDFTGRDEEVQQLEDLLGSGGGLAAISAIGGMGGMGKSALAFHVGRLVADQYPDGQIVVDMRGTSDAPLTPVDAMAEVVRAFNPTANLPDDIDAARQIYTSVLAEKCILIVLDNAENTVQVSGMLPPESCGMIVTSRSTIVLPGARQLNVDALSEEESRDLLKVIIGETQASEAELDEIARLCGRLPLALRVAGTFMAGHPNFLARDYINKLADEKRRLEQLKQDDVDVEATLGLSAAQLAREQPELAERWQMLSVFPGTFHRNAVIAVWDASEQEALDGLGTLVERSLLLYDDESTRYRLHDLMRPVAENAFAYGEGKRDSRREQRRLSDTAARHATHYQEVIAFARLC